MRQTLKLQDMAFLTRGAVSTSSTFSPSSVSGLYEWMHTDYGLFQDTGGTTPVTSDGQTVKKWLGTEGVLGPTEATNGPTYKTNIVNGRPAVLFNGTNQRLKQDSGTFQAQPQTMLLVAKMITLGNYHPILDGGASRRWLMAEYPDNVWDLWISSGTDRSIGVANTNWNIWTVVWNGASTKYGFNTSTLSTISASPGTNELGGITMGSDNGGANWGNCYIAEFLWYNGTVSAGNITSLVNYLGAKFGISVT